MGIASSKSDIIRQRRNKYTGRSVLHYNDIVLYAEPRDSHISPKDRLVMDVKIVPLNSDDDTPVIHRGILAKLQESLERDGRFNNHQLIKREMESHICLHLPRNHPTTVEHVLRSFADEMEVPEIMLTFHIGEVLSVRRSRDGRSLVASMEIWTQAVPGAYQQREQLEPHTLLDLCLYAGASLSYGVRSSGFLDDGIVGFHRGGIKAKHSRGQ